MFAYILKRLLYTIPTLFAISIMSFIIIQLPPGDYFSVLASKMAKESDTIANTAALEAMGARYGLNEPLYVQYWKWISGIVLRGDFGQSFEYNRPVSVLLWDRLGLTFLLSFSTLIFVWAVSFPIGIYSAVRKYSIGDYLGTFIGFVGLAIPNFLMALVLMYVSFKYFGRSVGGLFSPEFVNAEWSWARLMDFLAHLWIPVIVLGTAGTAGLIRIMRANMLDEIYKPYVVTARAKGLSEIRLLFKYPVRVALNPFISTVGWVLPELVSGATITAIVLSLPTTGPLLLRSLISQDMYLAGSFIMMLSVLTVLGTLISDILLAWLDPRIRFK
ncbi:ABC transporter permease [Oceaniglobus trochenteri]|uniref:ABC transporter permease n=1 Tax=Oceaniglobus trochenteri TaxID=2763260 RepID=UPI001CFFE49B